MAQARTIRESHQAAKDRDAAQAKFPRFEEAWEGWSWRIARGPDAAFAVPGFPNFYLFKSHGGFAQYGVPQTTILYKIVDDDTVEVFGLLVA